QLITAAMGMAQSVKYDSLGTFEFLVSTNGGEDATFAFIEANPRLQVEHTVTEEVTGVDLVKAQLQLAFGQSLRELGLDALHHEKPRGFAIELRINAESMAEDASVRPSNGTINVFEAPSGPGLRVDSYAYAGYSTNPRFDSLLAKLVAYSPSANFAETVNKAYRALCKFRIEGVATNLGFLQALLKHPDFRENRINTGFVEEKIAELAASAQSAHRRLYFERPSPSRAVGAKIDAKDPLAILHLGKSAAPQVEQPAMRRYSRSHGRPVSSGRWRSKVRRSSGIATSRRSSPVPRSVRSGSTKWLRACISVARRSTSRHTLRSTTR